MASSYMEVIRIEAVKPIGEECYQFAMVLDGPSGSCRLVVPVDTLLSYQSTQRLILRHTGYLWRHAAVEGRPPEAQAEQWASVLAMFLQQPVQLAAGSPESSLN